MPPNALENLARIGQLKVEPRNNAEVQRMLDMARTRLTDAQISNLSAEGRFSSVYNAAHVAALAALRWHGYRSENRYTVFQCLTHTLNWPTHQCALWTWPIKNATWLNTKGIWKLRSRRFRSCVRW